MKEVKKANTENNDSQPGRCAPPKGNSSEQTQGFSQPILTDPQRFHYLRITAANEDMLYLSVCRTENRLKEQKMREAGKKSMTSMASWRQGQGEEDNSIKREVTDP